MSIQQEGIRSFKGHKGTVYLVSVDHRAKYLASAGSDMLLNVWNVETGDLVVAYSVERSPLSSMAWSHDGQFLGVGLDSG